MNEMSKCNTGRPSLGYPIIPSVLLLPCGFATVVAKSQEGVGVHV